MSQYVVGFSINPRGASGTPITRGGKLPLVAILAINFLIVSVKNSIVRQLLLARVARGAFSVVGSSFAEDSFRLEYGSSTPWTIPLRVLRFD